MSRQALTWLAAMTLAVQGDKAGGRDLLMNLDDDEAHAVLIGAYDLVAAGADDFVRSVPSEVVEDFVDSAHRELVEGAGEE